ncbi:hypothetical protein J6590_063435 [Homalodisca vitripennis]|nr:hypothetical protein J6590_063435 [Homalodisca vitripennis]
MVVVEEDCYRTRLDARRDARLCHFLREHVTYKVWFPPIRITWKSDLFQSRCLFIR